MSGSWGQLAAGTSVTPGDMAHPPGLLSHTGTPEKDFRSNPVTEISKLLRKRGRPRKIWGLCVRNSFRFFSWGFVSTLDFFHWTLVTLTMAHKEGCAHYRKILEWYQPLKKSVEQVGKVITGKSGKYNIGEKTQSVNSREVVLKCLQDGHMNILTKQMKNQ